MLERDLLSHDRSHITLEVLPQEREKTVRLLPKPQYCNEFLQTTSYSLYEIIQHKQGSQKNFVQDIASWEGALEC